MRDKLINWLGGFTTDEMMVDLWARYHLLEKVQELEAKLSRKNQPRDSKGRFTKA